MLQPMGLQRVRHGATELTDRDSGKSWFKNQTIESKMKTTHWFQQLCGCLRQEEKCSSAQRKKGLAFNGTTLTADFPRTRESEDNGLASVKC